MKIQIPVAATIPGLVLGPSIVEVTPSFNNRFPASDFNRNVSVPFWGTQVSGADAEKSQLIETLGVIASASFVVYDKSFYNLLGADVNTEKHVEKVFTFPDPPTYAQRQVHDGTVYMPETDTIYFAELYSPRPGYSMEPIPFVWQVKNASTSSYAVSKAYPQPALTIANGAYYHEGSVYWAVEGNTTVPGGIVRMDPNTLRTEVVLNNYYGHRFNSPNDIVISTDSVAYFTDGYYGWDNFKSTQRPELANGVYRWDMKSGSIRLLAGAGDGTLYNPNGVALTHDGSRLYVTSRGNTSADAWGQRNIRAYQITRNGAVDRGLFAYVDSGFPDGIKTDKHGRLYAGVTGSVDVFDEDHTLLGRIKVDKDDVAVNMVWVKNWLYIAGRTYLYRVQLNSAER